MNKYQEAYNLIFNELIPMPELNYIDVKRLFDSMDLLQELVDKETPKKVLNKHKEYCFPSAYRLSGKCPNCKNHVDESKYCNRCGQKLDWSDTNE